MTKPYQKGSQTAEELVTLYILTYSQRKTQLHHCTDEAGCQLDCLERCSGHSTLISKITCTAENTGLPIYLNPQKQEKKKVGKNKERKMACHAHVKI